MARGAINISVTGDYNDRDINRAIRDLNRLKTESAAATPAMASLGKGFAAAGAALAGMVGLQQVTQFLKESAQAAIEDEKSMRSLAQAMTNVGLAGQLPEIETGIERLSRMFGIADDQLRPAFQQLALVTEDVTQSQNLLALAMDISAGTGRDLESVTMALAKAAGGQTTALGRLGVGLDSALLKSKDMDAITAELARKFGGQAAAAADTYGGKMARLSVAVDEAKEAIGLGLLDALDRMSESMGGTDGAIAFIDELGIKLGNAARGFGIAGEKVINFRNDIFGSLPFLNRFKLTLVDTLLLGVNPLIVLLSKLGDESDDLGTEMQGAVPGVTGLGGALGILDIKARSASEAFAILYGNVNKFAKAGVDSGLARADRAERLAAGLAIDVDDVVTSNMRSGGSKAAETISKHMQQALAQANLILQNAGATPMMQSFNVAQAIFGNVAEQFGPAQDAVRGLFDQAFSVLGEKIEAARQIGQQVADGLTGQLSLATALEKAKETGQSIVEAFIDQGAKVKAFATNLQRLMSAGLSKQAFDEIVNLGYQRGADVADALLTGNVQENVRRANEVYTSVNSIAVQTGNQAAAAFGQVGIQMAIDMMQALIDALTGKKGKAYRTLQDAMTALAASLYRKTYIDVETRHISAGGDGFSVGDLSIANPATAAALGLSPAAFEAAQASALAGTGGFRPDIPEEGRRFVLPRAAGGPVQAGRPFLIGELGPELFIPGQSGTIVPNHALGGGATYNITVQAGVGDPREIGRQVVEAIKSFERASGPVFVNA